jgi:flagellar hook-length control protein FliK
LVVLTDRPEIQELLRRHIDVLAQEFKALRYESVSFYFNADGQSGDNERSA